MKRLLFFICTLLCANVLMAQTTFWIDSLQYEVTSTNPAEVEVYDANDSITIANISSIVSYGGTDYSVTSIGGYAFYNKDNLTSVTIPNTVTAIGTSTDTYGAFELCESLTSVTIPNSVTSIGRYTFYSCSSLTSIDIPNSVTSIGEWAFRGCSSLTSIDIPNSVTSIGNYAFAYCYSLTSVTIPNSVTSIGRSAFAYCSSLTSIDIPNSVTSIGRSAFQNCSSLTSVTIPNSITSIGWYAFEYCNSLTSVTCLANTPPSLEYNVFIPTPPNKVLYVPCGSLEAYSNSDWNNYFTNRIFELNREVEISLNNSDFGSVAVESDCVEATLTATANEGYAFLSWNDGNTDNPRIVSLSSDTAFTAYFGNTLIIDTICQGSTYEENNFNETEQGFYTQTTTDANGQDSVTVLSLTVNPIFNTELTATICQGQAYTENNFNVSEAGVYTQTLTAVNGCDSIVTLTLTVNPIYNTELLASICEGQVYTENGFNVSEAGVYTQTLQTVNGCDSIVTLTLNVNPIFNTELSATICEGQTYTENGFNASEAGVYTQTLQTVNGCDSIVTLTLNVNPIYHLNLSTTICEGYSIDINGFNVSEAGTFTQTFTAMNGCDSVVTLTVVANPRYETELTATICEGQVYADNGFNVSEAGVYTQTLQTVNGCDSIVTLSLNVNPTFNTELSATICQGQVYAENGFNVSEAGVYTQTLTSVNGCDSIVTLTLNVNPIYNTELTATICEGQVYTENGFNVSEAGVYTQTLTAVNGCDSIVTLTLNVNPIYNTELTATICEGQVYTENNFNVSEAGVYTQTLTSVNGCDSIVTLTLNVNPIYNTELSATICEGSVYTENNFNVSEAGVYTQTLTSVNGCDSVVTLTISVNPTFDTTINATINAGETYTEFGFNESEAGTYVQNLQTEAGCDSTITLVLSVNSSLLEVEIEEISFFPNPTDSKITFSQKIEKVEVIDLIGKVIFTFTNAKTINLESLPSGAYYLRLTNDEKTIMQKVIKR